MLRLKYLIPLLIFLFVCVFLFVGLYLDPRKVPSALIDKPAPEFSLPTMSGETSLHTHGGYPPFARPRRRYCACRGKKLIPDGAQIA